MALEMDARRTAWQLPKRPDWVERINGEGSLMNLDELIPLDEDLIGVVRRFRE